MCECGSIGAMDRFRGSTYSFVGGVDAGSMFVCAIAFGDRLEAYEFVRSTRQPAGLSPEELQFRASLGVRSGERITSAGAFSADRALARRRCVCRTI
jgi:hypothetical protein